MPTNEATTVETTTDTTGETPEPTAPLVPVETPDDDAHDPERAKALIDKLRPFEKQAKQLAKDLDAAQKQLKAIDDEKLSEVERLQKQVDALTTQATDAATLTEQLERSNAALSTYVAQLRDGLPQSVLVLLDKSDQAEQLEWLTANRTSIMGNGTHEPEKLPTKGVPVTPKANANGIPDDERKARAANTWRG